ncbi:MAG TPA: lytic transglycosylase domain-containing protein [Thermoanaerobaculia bacterium]|nr:lytic transglycosylase domain-containing protein [Thermoanaerobaculia bacterium]
MRRSLLLIGIGLTLGSSSLFAAGKFSASSIKGTGLKHTGHLAISNDSRAITVLQFDGQISKALLTLKSSRTLAYHPFGSVYQSNAPLTAPMPAFLSQIIQEAAQKHGVDPRLIAAVAARESRYNAAAVSPVGAQGVMQLMPATARYLGVTNPFDARENVVAGTKYLRLLLDTFKGDLDLTLAAYNAGPGAVQRFGGVPPFRETMDYVRSIRTNYEASVKKF